MKEAIPLFIDKWKIKIKNNIKYWKKKNMKTIWKKYKRIWKNTMSNQHKKVSNENTQALYEFTKQHLEQLLIK